MPALYNVLRQCVAPAFLGVMLAACSHQTGPERSKAIRAQAEQAGWRSQVIHTPQFDLQSLSNRQEQVGGVLTIYLEGDGYAWVDGQFASDDPTPHNPVGLQLAMAQPGPGAVAYLGRPCQYMGAQTDGRCNKTVWTDARFSEHVVAAVDAAIGQLKQQRGARQITLVGYSGGAAIALLVASRRQDVARIITVAGNLDPQAWATQMRLRPLTSSLDTATVIHQTAAIQQVDFVGGKDNVVPPTLTEAFAQKFPTGKQPRIINVPHNTHSCCWVQQWPTLWPQAQSKETL